MSHGICLGFDYGRLRIGVAVGETITGTARPLTTLRCRSPGQVDWGTIAGLVREWEPELMVVGLPSHEDGQPGDTARESERFARRLRGRFGLPVHLVNEHLSTRAARKRLADEGREGKSRDRDAAVDMMAAAVILETWLATDTR